MFLYKFLEDNKKRINFLTTNEYKFYIQNKEVISDIPMYRDIYTLNDDFSLIRVIIVIKSLLNKFYIEHLVSFYLKNKNFEETNRKLTKKDIENKLNELSFIDSYERRIYVPIFSRQVNQYYTDEWDKLFTGPWASLVKNYKENLIDPFETFSFDLFNSTFTNLLFIKKTDDLVVLYSETFETVYFINDQGRLENKLALHDRFLKKYNTENIVERILPVVDAYLQNNREKMIFELEKNGLISAKLLTKLKKKNLREQKRILKKIR